MFSPPARPRSAHSFLAFLLVALTAAMPAHRTAADDTEPFRTSVGPWGRLQCYYFYLEAPDNLVSDVPIADTQTRWCVPNEELETFKQQIARTDLPNDLVSALFSPRNVIVRNGITNLFPSVPLVESLSPADRSGVAERLSLFPGNDFHSYPIFFLSSSVQDWARGSGMPDDAVSRIESLSYMRGNSLVFSDLPVVISHAKSDSEARLLQKKFTRVRTLIARLEIDDNTNAAEMANYWSTGLNLRRKEVEPLIMATAGLPGTQYLDIVHLLPALPRKLLYTYPSDDVTASIRLPDCHWTTLNFFNYKAQDYYLDTKLAASAILENFNAISPPYRYGDVLMFVDANGDAFHSFVYLAADIVYSKNGRNPLLPWMLIEMADLKKMYMMNDQSGNGSVQGFRHKLSRSESTSP